MKVLLINLARDIERRLRMKRILKGAGLEYVVVDAIIGKDLSGKDLDFFVSRSKMTLRPAEYGCMLGHLKAWRFLIDSGEPAAFVAEDDIYVSFDLKACLNELKIPRDGPSVTRLETFGGFVLLRRAAIQQIGQCGVH